MESDKKMFFLLMIMAMLYMDSSTYYPKSFISLDGVAAQDPEASASGTTSYNVINGASGTIHDNGSDNVENGDNTSSQKLPPPVSVPAPSAVVPAELQPPTSVSVPQPPTSVSAPAPSTTVAAELPPPTSVSTPSNVVPIYGGRYGFPWFPIQVSESKYGDSRSASEPDTVKKQH